MSPDDSDENAQDARKNMLRSRFTQGQSQEQSQGQQDDVDSKGPAEPEEESEHSDDSQDSPESTTRQDAQESPGGIESGNSDPTPDSESESETGEDLDLDLEGSIVRGFDAVESEAAPAKLNLRDPSMSALLWAMMDAPESRDEYGEPLRVAIAERSGVYPETKSDVIRQLQRIGLETVAPEYFEATQMARLRTRGGF